MLTGEQPERISSGNPGRSNARPELLLATGARDERTLAAVSSRPLFGAASIRGGEVNTSSPPSVPATARARLWQQGKDTRLGLGTVLHREHTDNDRGPSGRQRIEVRHVLNHILVRPEHD